MPDKTNDKSKTDWRRVDMMPDGEIDTSDIPPLSEAFFLKATLRMPPGTKGRPWMRRIQMFWRSITKRWRSPAPITITFECDTSNAVAAINRVSSSLETLERRLHGSN